MKIYVLIIAMIGLAFSSTGLASEYKTLCDSLPVPLEGNFCIHQPLERQSNNVLYYLHGLNGNEKQWGKKHFFTEQLRQQWAKTNSPLATVVSVSFGPNWLLAEKNKSPFSGLYELFTQGIIPRLESQLGFKVKQRHILGYSMGGFNGVQLSLKSDLFQKAAIICAPMSELSPFASDAEILDYAKASGAWEFYKGHSPDTVLEAVFKSQKLASAFYPSPKAWSKGNPLDLVESLESSKTKFYLTIGYYDKYVSFEANKLFAKALKKKTKRTTWRPQWGGHCSVDIPSLARFLTRK